jgi:16S rRNA G966 N2-methylase RsmD
MSKTWFAIDGALEPIDYAGPTFFRFPLELAERVITEYSAPGAWILDPFCGLGTTLVAAQRLGRRAIGFEKDADRGHFAAGRVEPLSRVVVDDAQHASRYTLPRFDLLFSSPPYTSFRGWDDEGFAPYEEDLRLIFTMFASLLRPGGKVVLETCNVREGSSVRTVAWNAARVLADVFQFDGEIVRVNTGHEPAGPGFDHSYLLVFTHQPAVSAS